MLATVVDWAALATTAWVSAAIGLGVLLVAALGVTASLEAQDHRSAGGNGAAAVFTGVTVVCVAGLLAAVVYGVYLIAR